MPDHQGEFEMFYGKRLKALEARVEKLENDSFLESPTENEVYGSWFGHGLTRPKRLPTRQVIYAVLNFLNLDIKRVPEKPETFSAVKRKVGKS